MKIILSLIHSEFLHIMNYIGEVVMFKTLVQSICIIGVLCVFKNIYTYIWSIIKYFRRQIEIHKRLIDELRTNIKELGDIIETFKKDTIEKDKEHKKKIDELSYRMDVAWRSSLSEYYKYE